MAHRTTYPVESPRTDVRILTAKLTGGGAAGNLTPVTAEANNGEVVTATNTGTGKWTLTFRHAYPEFRGCAFGFVGTTDGLNAQFASIDVTTKTAALEVYVGSTATDLATTDTITITLFVRNSGKNS